MSVFAVHYEINGGEIPSSVNYGLILGLAIPLSLLLIAGILYFICASMESDGAQSQSYNQMKSGREYSSMTYELKENI